MWLIDTTILLIRAESVGINSFIAMVKSMDEAFTGGQMDQSMKESGLTTGLKAKALTTGQMEESS